MKQGLGDFDPQVLCSLHAGPLVVTGVRIDTFTSQLFQEGGHSAL